MNGILGGNTTAQGRDLRVVPPMEYQTPLTGDSYH